MLGTKLREILSPYFKYGKHCSCDSVRAMLDEKGTEWAKANYLHVIKRMEREARRKGVIPSEAMCKLALAVAIDLTEREVDVTADSLEDAEDRQAQLRAAKRDKAAGNTLDGLLPDSDHSPSDETPAQSSEQGTETSQTVVQTQTEVPVQKTEGESTTLPELPDSSEQGTHLPESTHDASAEQSSAEETPPSSDP